MNCEHNWWYDVTSRRIDDKKREIRFCTKCNLGERYVPFITIQIGNTTVEFLHKFKKIKTR